MPKNYLIGIGGTGARVIEATVHICAAGYGPDDLSIFIIDPDEGNGNLTRTKNLITLYQDCKKNFHPTSGTKLFKTNITIPDPLVWNIFKDQNTTLAHYIFYQNMRQSETQKDLADFVSVLFSEDELNTPLNEGFRGHPSIGSVVMSNPPEDKDPWKVLRSDITNAQKVNDVRVFLIGSIFGGTGAAGVPTIGSKELIKFHKEANLGPEQSKVLLGGALVLPYFTFEIDSKTEEKMFVTGSDFPIATKAALQYYNEKALGFDQLYFLGDSLGQKVGKFSHGSKTQENLPHYIEIVANLAACDFFEQPPVQGIPERQYFIASREDDKVSWNSLPFARTPEMIQQRHFEFKSSIVSMTAFAYSFSTYGQKILNSDHKEIKQTWYRDNFKFNEKDERDHIKNPRLGDNKTRLDNFRKFSELFLAWICDIDDVSNNVKLIDRRQIIESDIEVGKPVRLFNPESYKSNIGNLLKDKLDKPTKLDFNHFINELDNVKIKDRPLSAADRFISIFYEGAWKFCSMTYDIK